MCTHSPGLVSTSFVSPITLSVDRQVCILCVNTFIIATCSVTSSRLYKESGNTIRAKWIKNLEKFFLMTEPDWWENGRKGSFGVRIRKSVDEAKTRRAEIRLENLRRLLKSRLSNHFHLSTSMARSTVRLREVSKEQRPQIESGSMRGKKSPSRKCTVTERRASPKEPHSLFVHIEDAWWEMSN